MVHGPDCVESQFSCRELVNVWEEFPPPIRPSLQDQQVYHECIRKIDSRRNPRVLILGVTPELRALAIQHHCMVIAVDLHAVMISAMNSLMDNFGIASKDAIVRGHWLAMPFRSGIYDLILSDCAVNSLTKAETEMLFAELKRLLEKNSYVCMRVMICPQEATQQNILDILAKHRKDHEDDAKEIFRDLYLKILCSIEAYDPASQKSSIDKARKEWRRLYSNNGITKQEFGAFENILSEGDYCPTLLNRRELEEILRHHFEVVFIENDEFNGYSPIYFLKLR